jgi:UDP-N-acetylmuramate: L-alanyl-gamma-D-glutamyl-meso-diaminopimelate ligase
LNQVVSAFKGFLSGLSPYSMLFAYDSDTTIDTILADANCPVVRYGKKKQSFWALGEITRSPPWTTFEIIKKGSHFNNFQTKLLGEHNLLNVLSAIALAESIHLPTSSVVEALRTFQGVKRRQEVRGVKKGITVMDDFAHHPTAVRETIRAVKPIASDGRLVAVFEPRTHASMRKVFQEIYPASFEGSDLICVREPPMLHKVPPDDQFSSKRLVEDLTLRGKDAHYFPDTEAIIEFLNQTARSGDLILIMSNGGFDNIHERLLKSL